MALLEHTTYDPQNGAPINSNLADYIVAVNADVPPLKVHFLDFPDKEIKELGARGIGEIGLAGVAAGHHRRSTPRNRCSCTRTDGENREFVGVRHTFPSAFLKCRDTRNFSESRNASCQTSGPVGTMINLDRSQVRLHRLHPTPPLDRADEESSTLRVELPSLVEHCVRINFVRGRL
jgi:hypothetical protein